MSGAQFVRQILQLTLRLHQCELRLRKLEFKVTNRSIAITDGCVHTNVARCRFRCVAQGFVTGKHRTTLLALANDSLENEQKASTIKKSFKNISGQGAEKLEYAEKKYEFMVKNN